jgi:hypothetical protein
VTNADLARQLVAQADDAMHRRKALLCASVVLATTSTVPAAVRALSDWDGPADIKAAAIEVLGQLATEVP